MMRLMHAAAEVAQLAGRTALRHYRGGLAVEWKADGSPVTAADRESERVARDWIAERFPADGISGEEFGERPGTSGRQWMLDPIDGTKSYVRGVPLWGSLVAVIEDGVVLAGAAAYPAAGETIVAAPGLGCWHNDAPCRVSTVERLEEATVLITDALGFDDPAIARGWERLAATAALARGWGDCFGYLLVATGRAEVMVDPKLNPWDAACFQPILAEAGGLITDLGGAARATLPSAIATNGALAAEARRMLNAGGAP